MNQTTIANMLTIIEETQNKVSSAAVKATFDGVETAVYGDRMLLWLPDYEVTDYFINGSCREDSPLPLQQHFQLLTNAGFDTIDTLWKKQIFGIYISIKE